MHRNERFNIMQAESNRPEFVILDGQRAPGGYAAPGATVISRALPRDMAIQLADELQRNNGMRLVYVATGMLVLRGDVVQLHGKAYTVGHFSRPHAPDSEGKVALHAAGGDHFGREYYVSVIGAKWVDRRDQEQ